jgi:hypothetical protein
MATVALGAARAQSPSPEPTQLPPVPGMPGMDQEQERIKQLFRDVELRLREIDTLLYDAGAGKVPKEPVENAGIDRLLRDAAQRGQAVKEDIDKILELAKRMKMQGQPSGSSSQPDQEPQPGQSPLDRQRGQEPSGREKTPTKPEESKPDQGGKPEDGQPKNPFRDDPNADPKNRQGGPPPPSATERNSTADSRDRWGDLPIHVREVFRVEGGSDLPPQYRDWIDGYYRRLQQSARQH